MSAPSILAKFKVEEVTKHAYGAEAVKMRAVYEQEGVNKSFAKATPSGSLEITIDNPEAQNFFIAGKEYFLAFTPADPAAE